MPVKFRPLSLLCVIRLFRFCYFRRFRHSESSLRGRRLKGKGKGVLGKGVLGARETRGAREEGGLAP